MTGIKHKEQQARPRWHADYSVWFIWLTLVLVVIAILPFTIRNSEVVRQIAAMCGFTIN
ncbi:hypothetical protein N8500_02860 [Candidatus Puniceispirillum sp.]|nr:hypothetical protein [Candidatus Puniceispirillum sp.]